MNINESFYNLNELSSPVFKDHFNEGSNPLFRKNDKVSLDVHAKG